MVVVRAKKELRKHELLNQEIIDKNNEAKEELQVKVRKLTELNARIDILNAQEVQIEDKIVKSKEIAETTAENYYNTHLKLVQERFERAAEQLAAQYQQTEEDYNQAYKEMLESSTKNYLDEMQVKKDEIAKLDEQLSEYQNKVAAAVESNKREEAKRTQEEFYKLQLSDEDIQEISKLREILPYLRQKEPLNKVIYKVYYEKPYTDLVGRVIGSGTHTGIYKITNSKNGMCYVGQAVDLADRWKTHVRRGVGADPPGRNKLYPAMLAFGIENFTFEVVEECQAKDLNEREQFWQDYFKAKEFGYSIR